ncbi:MAG: hypothetical protein ACOCTQ_03465, partial [Planctomycetota bacterium]
MNQPLRLLPQRRDAEALILALVVIGFLTAILGSASAILLTGSRRLQYERRRMTSLWLARSGIELGLSRLPDPNRQFTSLSGEWATGEDTSGHRLSSGEFGLGLGMDAGDSDIRPISDAESRINVNAVPLSTLESALPGIQERTLTQIEERREKRQFITVRELRGLLNSVQTRELEQLFTVHGTGRLNVNTTTRRMLSCMPGVTDELAETIIQRRRGPDGRDGTEDDRPFRDKEALRSFFTDHNANWKEAEQRLTVRSSYFIIYAWGRSGRNQRTGRTLRAIADNT